MIKIRNEKKGKMKKIIYILFALSLLLDNIALAAKMKCKRAKKN